MASFEVLLHGEGFALAGVVGAESWRGLAACDALVMGRPITTFYNA